MSNCIVCVTGENQRTVHVIMSYGPTCHFYAGVSCQLMDYAMAVSDQDE